MDIRELIGLAGGAPAVAEASARTDHQVGVDAVYKWFRNGIPEDHWPLIIKRTGVSVEIIYRANQKGKRCRQQRGVGRCARPNGGALRAAVT